MGASYFVEALALEADNYSFGVLGFSKNSTDF